MIVLEGPNGAGKSTLAKKLSKDLGFRIHKFDKVPETREEWQANHEESLRLLKEPVIQDRCPAISELIYREMPFCNIDDAANFLGRAFNLLPVMPSVIFVSTDDLQPKEYVFDDEELCKIQRKYSILWNILGQKLDLKTSVRLLSYDYKVLNSYEVLLYTLTLINSI